MSGASDPKTGISVSSWGWLNDNGEQAGTADDATWRLWSVSRFANRVAFIARPVALDAGDVLVEVYRMFYDE